MSTLIPLYLTVAITITVLIRLIRQKPFTPDQVAGGITINLMLFTFLMYFIAFYDA
jgi:hypothetical protein